MSLRCRETRLLRWPLVLTLAVLFSVRLVVASPSGGVNSVAERYVKLVLEIGLYEPAYVDSYYGPADWVPSLETATGDFPAEALRTRTQELITQLGAGDRMHRSGIDSLRRTFLIDQLRAVQAKIDLLDGAEMSFDQESKALYGVVLPPFDQEHYQRVLQQLDELLPGEGDLGKRLDEYNRKFAVPRDKAQEAIKATIAQYRKWTVEHVTLPAEEGFDIQFVHGKPWMANLKYKGDGRSLLQVSLSRALSVGEIEIVAGHELYPGHHTYAVLLDTHLRRGRGWIEYSIMPLNSPLTLIAEGMAEYGFHDLVASPADRIEFRRQVLFPMLGIDPNEAQRYSQVVALSNELWGPRVELARRYQDDTMDYDEMMPWIRRHCVVASGGEYRVVRTVNAFGTYLVTYSVGRTLIADYMASQIGPNADTALRWELFQRLLSAPRTPSTLTPTAR